MEAGTRVGFIGLGVMGEPMCRHIAQKAGPSRVSQVVGFDLDNTPLTRLGQFGVLGAQGIEEVVDGSDLILISLPGDPELEALCMAEGGLLHLVRAGQTVVDLGTSSVRLSRSLQEAFAERGCAYADAPVARTRAAAESGTLLVLVGSELDLYEQIRPVLSCFAEEVLHCGAVGAGQVVKQMNNMVLFQTVNALAEALATAREAGVDGETLFNAFTLGSADSFALRNHGLKSLLPGAFPERAFSTTYALKDLTFAMRLAEEGGVATAGAAATKAAFDRTIAAGWGDQYFPAIIKTLK
ncbi:MAG: NAD(P)-dependent oxidoreductase [Pseudomonadota bacterium]